MLGEIKKSNTASNKKTPLQPTRAVGTSAHLGFAHHVQHIGPLEPFQQDQLGPRWQLQGGGSCTARWAARSAGRQFLICK